MVRPSAIICADWAKKSDKRAVYVADVLTQTVARVASSEWSFAAVLREAKRWSSNGSVLVVFDAPLGVPESYLAAARQVQCWKSPKTFLELLARAHSTPGFFDTILSS